MKESKESIEEEKAESLAEQKKEEMSGSEVPIPEEFQKQTHALLHKANKHQVKHVHDVAYAREAELNKSDKHSKAPLEFSTADMPS